MNEKLTINIAGLYINVFIDEGFKGIKTFLRNFEDAGQKKSDKDVKVYFLRGGVRKVELSETWDSLYITGNNIDELTDPFNLIGITQAIFRFVAVHLAIRGIFLIHGSASVLDNRIICFGDDGDSTAKTLSSLEIAVCSKKYIADEFCFFDSKTGKIFGYPLIPIHIRQIVKKHLSSLHNISIPKDKYKETDAGYFFTQEKLFKTMSGDLTSMVYVHFSGGGPILERLSTQEEYRSFKFCITSHIAKLIYPNLDRMQFASTTDTSEQKIINEKVIDDILYKITNGEGINPQIFNQFASYRLTVSNPCQTVTVLREKIFEEHL